VTWTVGLTGGIGSGKSTVASMLGALGAAVVDTDEVSRELTGPHGAAMQAIGREFGARFVTAEGALDRAAMRALVFEDALARARLEAILHPAIRAQTQERLAAASAAYAVVAVPLLFETRDWIERADRILVVDCSEALQVERTVRRSSLAGDEVRRIMAAQWPRWRRLQMAHDVAWNGGSIEALEAQCSRLHAFYVAHAGHAS
jgi:dephospho-CoA kinase